jgi:hypothetical protein
LCRREWHDFCWTNFASSISTISLSPVRTAEIALTGAETDKKTATIASTIAGTRERQVLRMEGFISNQFVFLALAGYGVQASAANYKLKLELKLIKFEFKL